MEIFFGTLFEINLLSLPNQIVKMTKKYFYSLLFLAFICLSSYAQDNKQQSKNQDTIEGLSFYPNPVSNGKVYILSKLSLTKEIYVFDILGKEVLQTTLTTKELNVSALSPGVYMMRIKEGEATATRKLIIK